MTTFEQTGAFDAAQGLSDLINIYLHDDDIQDFDIRWEQALLSASEVPKGNVLESLCKTRIRESVQTVFAMYEQEID